MYITILVPCNSQFLQHVKEHDRSTLLDLKPRKNEQSLKDIITPAPGWEFLLRTQ